MKLAVIAVPDDESAALAGMCSRNMQLAVTIQDGTIWVSSDSSNIQIDLKWLQRERTRYDR